MITKKEISEALALSCVESYFLPWISKYYDITKLYGRSFISVKQVLDDFANGARYENYNRIPRVQSIAEESGIVSHKFIKCSNKRAINILRNQTERDLCLIRVNAKFFSGYKRAAWREDHYICVNNNLDWINQYPLSEGHFEESDFEKIYDGVVCLYTVDDSVNDIFDYLSCLFELPSCEIINISNNLEAVSSAIGILRISRKRLAKYYQANIVVHHLLCEEIVLLDKLYLDVNFLILQTRQRTGENKRIIRFNEALQNIIGKEKIIWEALLHE